MTRTLLVCALIGAWPAVSRAQQPPASTETVIALTVQSMAAPRPALRYRFVPELKEMSPGNAIQGYLNCFMEQQHFFFSKEAADLRDRCLNLPLKDLPLAELRSYVDSPALKQADYAARLESFDWQLLLKQKSEGVSMRLPDIQQLRMLANALKVRFRVEVAERRFDDAMRTAQTLFALARHAGEHTTFVGDLVGLAITQVALGPLEEMVQQAGCPNLYWALTELPAPFIRLDKGMQGERTWLVAYGFSDLFDKAAPLTQDQLLRCLSAIRRLDVDHVLKEDAAAWFARRSQDARALEPARQRLLTFGLTGEQLKAMPPLQIMLLDDYRRYEAERDDGLKWIMLPHWQLEKGMAAEPRATRGTGADRIPSFFSQAAPATLQVCRARTRVDRRIALLRHVEALRLYAAENDGKLPTRLSDVTVPLPVDPFTGEPFAYSALGDTAVLQATAPKGEEKNAAYNVRYKVTIKN